MQRRRNVCSLLAVACVVLICALPTTHGENSILCYFGSWSTYRPGSGKFDVENIDPHLCTHLAYGFAGLDRNKYTIRVLDPWNDLDDNWGKGAYRRFNNLKQINPNLKTLLSVGGWNEGASSYSTMAADPAKRKIFIDSTLALLNKHHFDGLDFDWEYPGGRDDSPGRPVDRDNYIVLLSELRAAFDNNQPRLMLTAAVSAGESTIDKAYNVPEMNKYLDFFNVMTYDFHGWFPGHTYTGENSPLYAMPEEKDPNHPGHDLNTDWAIKHWISQGANPSKILLGMAAYGRGFRLANPSDHGLYIPAVGPIDAGPYTRTAGFWGFNEFCEKMRAESHQWALYRDNNAVAPYVVKGSSWFGFDDPVSILKKAEYVKEMGLGGAMIWSVDTDDFHGFCGRNFGLLNVIHDTLNGGSQTAP